MPRFGLVGVNTSHAPAFARIFNGTAEQPPQLEGGRIVTLWGDDRAKADELAATYDIPTVVPWAVVSVERAPNTSCRWLPVEVDGSLMVGAPLLSWLAAPRMWFLPVF